MPIPLALLTRAGDAGDPTTVRTAWASGGCGGGEVAAGRMVKGSRHHGPHLSLRFLLCAMAPFNDSI